MKVLELFGGIGACSKALERLGIDYEIADYVEIDKYAVKSFNAIHNTNFEPQDITTWDKDIEVDLIMHGSPCQDFSLAGKQAGGDEGSGTRSSLMYETIRIVEKLKPKYVIWENVKNVISKKHIHNFNNYITRMSELGYTSYYQILNAKDYGIPQNRERVFTVSILGNESYEFPKEKELEKIPLDFIEKDVDTKYNLTDKNIKHYQREFGSKGKELNLYEPIPTLTASMGTGGGNIPYFTFPPKQKLKLKLKDMLEDEVDEKYYLSDKMINFFYKNEQVQKEKGNGFRFNVTDGNVIAKTITTRAGSRMDDNFLKIKEATKQGYKEAFEGDGVNISSRMKYQRGNVQKESIQTITTSGGNDRGVVIKSKCKRLESLVEKTDFEEGKVLNMDLYNQTTNENISQCLTEPHHNSQRLFDGLRIRKLTPKECWRLMGFDDEDFEKAKWYTKEETDKIIGTQYPKNKTKKVFSKDGRLERMSNTQLYKQAGNSIVVNVLEAILRRLLK